MRYLLDTSALLAHYRKEPGGEAVQALFEAKETELLMASISLTEFGRRLRELGANETTIKAALLDYQLLCNEIAPVDVNVARTAFEIGCLTPHRLPLADALITAAAHNRTAILVHRDEHMCSIPSTVVQQYDLADGSD